MVSLIKTSRKGGKGVFLRYIKVYSTNRLFVWFTSGSACNYKSNCRSKFLNRLRGLSLQDKLNSSVPI